METRFAHSDSFTSPDHPYSRFAHSYLMFCSLYRIRTVIFPLVFQVHLFLPMS